MSALGELTVTTRDRLNGGAYITAAELALYYLLMGARGALIKQRIKSKTARRKKFYSLNLDYSVAHNKAHERLIYKIQWKLNRVLMHHE